MEKKNNFLLNIIHKQLFILNIIILIFIKIKYVNCNISIIHLLTYLRITYIYIIMDLSYNIMLKM